MLFVVVMVTMITISILASVQLATSSALLQSRRERDAKARFAYEGAMQLALTDYRRNVISIPTTTSYTVGDFTVKLTAVDNSSSLARTIKLNGEVEAQGTTLKFSRTVGNRKDPHPFYYAVFANENFDPVKAVKLGGSGTLGDICVNGSIVARLNSFIVNGDLEEKGTTLPATASVTGNTIKSTSTAPFPSVDKVLYLAASPVVIAVNAIAGSVFPAVEPYQLQYRTGDLSLSGAFTGKGTIFVDGNVTIAGNVSYGDSSSRLVVISTGSITVAAGVTSYVGFYYSPTEFKISAAAATLTSGSIAAQKLVLSGPLTATHDPAFWNDPLEGPKHRIPGFWP